MRSSEAGMKACPPHPGLTLMHSATSTSSSAKIPSGVAGFTASPARQPASRTAAERVVHVRRRLGVDDDRVGAGFGERGDLSLRALDHQVNLEVQSEVAQRAADRRPHRERRDEVPVHHVDVDDPRTGRLNLLDLLTQPPEVGGQD